MKVVADTNIYISALLFGGVPGTFLDLALLRAFQLVASEAILEELEEKLKEKFRVQAEDIEVSLRRIREAAVVVKPAFSLQVIADDPDDDRILECAVAAQADCIVSGDRHILRLGNYAGMDVLTVRQFLDRLQLPGM